jgi:CubicO group peptidase (beta-lactamase class C family)
MGSKETIRNGNIRNWGLIVALAAVAVVVGIVVWVLIARSASYPQPDYWPTAEWKTATPEQQGMRSDVLAGLFDQPEAAGLRSVVVVRNGYIVAEGYNLNQASGEKVDVYNVTQSIISALTGIAMQEGKLKNVNTTVASLLPDWMAFDDAVKKQITLQHLLTMTAGLKWDNTDERSTMQMQETDIWAQFYAGQPMTAGRPGEQFVFSNGSAQLMSAILEKVTGMRTWQYANEKLFGPLGIEDAEWLTDPSGTAVGSWGAHMSTRDMAKIGLLYLSGGRWEDKQIVPRSWVNKSTRAYVIEQMEDGEKRGFGYYWWIRGIDPKADPSKVKAKDAVYSAMGVGGQRIVVVPKYGMVIAMTGNQFSDPFFANRLIDEYILPAVKSDKPIGENPDGQALLADKIAAFKQMSN